MGNYLRLRFEDDTDGTGKLIARAQANGFSGEGAAHFSVTQLEEFAAALLEFPLPTDPWPSIAGGFWDRSNRGRLDQEHLAITAYQIDKRGRIGIQVRMSTEVWKGTRAESQMVAKVEIVTNYEPLAQFSRALSALVRGAANEAVLEGEPTA